MPRKPDPTTLCQHHSKDSKRCHMLLAADSTTLCAFHARSHAKRAASQRDDSADLSALFSKDLPKQKSAADIHTHLWNLSLALQQGRISPRRAAVLAYINSLLLRTLPAIDKQNSPHDSGGIDMTGAPRPIRNLPPLQHSPLQYSPGAYAASAASASPAVAAAFRFRSGESSDSHPATPTPTTVHPTPDETSKSSHSERSEEPAFRPAPDPRANTVLLTPDGPPPFGYGSSIPRRSVVLRGRLARYRPHHHANAAQTSFATRFKIRLSAPRESALDLSRSASRSSHDRRRTFLHPSRASRRHTHSFTSSTSFTSATSLVCRAVSFDSFSRCVGTIFVAEAKTLFAEEGTITLRSFVSGGKEQGETRTHFIGRIGR